ncbi:MAG: tetratricopeptide repeat protein [Caulobacteraceae bacterium]|nr:tetratricopeptide repeat protein [Caulobacteraceae bacterium]
MTSIDALYLAKAKTLISYGQLGAACDAYLEALRLNPGNTQALVDLGALQAKRGHDEQAQAAFADALAQAPDRVDACIWRGNALYRLKRYEEALAMQDRALELSPDFAPIHYNRGNALLWLRRHAESVSAFDRALALEPDLTAALANRGAALYELGRYDEAIADLVETMRRTSGGDRATAELHLSYNNLLRGDLAQGWRQLEARKRLDEPVAVGPYTNPEWLGAEDIAGKTVLVHAEQGLGDTVQFCRYLPMVAARAAKVVFACQTSLKRLISSLDPTLEIIDQYDMRPDLDFHVPLMSLALAFDTRLETIPVAMPYLAAEPERIAKWRKRIGEHGYRIGIAWKGSGLGAQLGKAFPVALLQTIAALPDVRLINLQIGEGWQELETLPPGMTVERLGEDFDAGPDAFLDAAAVMESLDLVIATDTGLAHLAGALRRPTWLALKYAPDWRWMLDRDDTPWYPSMRLFRQQAPDDWSAVFPAMRRALRLELERRKAG